MPGKQQQSTSSSTPVCEPEELNYTPAAQSRGNAFAQEQLSCQDEGQSNVITLDEITIEGDPNAHEEVDDARVQEIIDECYAKAWTNKEPDRTESAWYQALQMRKADQQDVNMAAAEHYLYAKYSGKKDGVLGAATTGLMAGGYDAVKAGAFALGVEDWLSTDGTKPSKPTLGSTTWGMKGAAEGLTED